METLIGVYTNFFMQQIITQIITLGTKSNSLHFAGLFKLKCPNNFSFNDLVVVVV